MTSTLLVLSHLDEISYSEAPEQHLHRKVVEYLIIFVLNYLWSEINVKHYKVDEYVNN